MSLEQYIVVRYYESEHPDQVDVIKFSFPANAKIRDLRKELENAWSSVRTGREDVDICAACDIIVKKYGGDYMFPVFDHLPLELK